MLVDGLKRVLDGIDASLDASLVVWFLSCRLEDRDGGLYGCD